MYEHCVSIMNKNGFTRESIKIMRSHARLLQRFSNDCNNIESKKDYMIRVKKKY
jgi:hypothetical protein